MTEHLPGADDEHEELDNPDAETPSRSYGASRRRAPRLSRGDVLQAADALLLDGERVTIDRVRGRLGRGSPNTIQEHLEFWWAELGSRLKDLPGREFPEIPADVGRDLKRLWDTAIVNARRELNTQWEARESALTARETDLEARARTLEDAAAAERSRYDAQDAALALAREQLIAANQRAGRLEASLDGRDAQVKQLAERVQIAEQELRTSRHDAQVALAAHETQREKLEARYEASESRWLQEVDRARQAVKVTQQAHERESSQARRRLETLEKSRDAEVHKLRAAELQLKAALKRCGQLEKDLKAATTVKRTSKRVRSQRSRPRTAG